MLSPNDNKAKLIFTGWGNSQVANRFRQNYCKSLNENERGDLYECIRNITKEYSRETRYSFFSSAILKFLQEIERRNFELHGLMILRHGHVVAEGWWEPYQLDIPHMCASLTKSFISTAIGFAVQEGLMSINDPIFMYFSDMITPEIQKNMVELQVSHLLTMTTGHQVDTTRFGISFDFLNHKPELSIGDRTDNDYIRSFLELPIQDIPGESFVYNSGASHILGAIVEFQPLGIEKPYWEWTSIGGNTGVGG